jgi:hypothetical protein
VQTNLRFARDHVQGPRYVLGPDQRWLGRLTLNEWTVLTAAALWTCLLSLALIQFRPALKRSLRGLAVLSGAASLLLAICLIAALTFRFEEIAIVIVPETNARSGRSEPRAFLLRWGN